MEEEEVEVEEEEEAEEEKEEENNGISQCMASMKFARTDADPLRREQFLFPVFLQTAGS